jgi:hypothetical protein
MGYNTALTNPPTLGITFSESDTRATASGTNNRCACHAAENSSIKNEFTASYSGVFGQDMAYLCLTETDTIPTGQTPQNGAAYHNFFMFNSARTTCVIKAYKDTTVVYEPGDMGASPKCYWQTDGTNVKFYVDDVLKMVLHITKNDYYVRACPKGPSVYMDIYGTDPPPSTGGVLYPPPMQVFRV